MTTSPTPTTEVAQRIDPAFGKVATRQEELKVVRVYIRLPVCMYTAAVHFREPPPSPSIPTP